MPLGLSITAKTNLLAGKYTFSYSSSPPLVGSRFSSLNFSYFPDITHSADNLTEYLEAAIMRSALSRKDVSIVTTDGASNIANVCSQLQAQH